MAHIHAQIDFVVSAFIVNATSKGVLLVHHKKLDGWFPPGGHIELHETPDEALDREIKEETGLIVGQNVHICQDRHTRDRVEIWGHLPNNIHNAKQLRMPWTLEIHDFKPVPDHRHIALVYRAIADTDSVKLETDAHHNIKWFDREMLNADEFNVCGTVRWYGHYAMTYWTRS